MLHVLGLVLGEIGGLSAKFVMIFVNLLFLQDIEGRGIVLKLLDSSNSVKSTRASSRLRY